MRAGALMLYTLWLFQSSRPVLLLPCTSLSLTNPPPPQCRLRSIQPCLPVPHVIFCLWHGSPLSAAWYSGVEMHAPSQIHQLRSECRTTARGNGGMRRVEAERGREAGREVVWEGRSVACRHPSRTKASGWWGANRWRGVAEDEKKENEHLFISEEPLLLISISFQISVSEEFKKHTSYCTRFPLELNK